MGYGSESRGYDQVQVLSTSPLPLYNRYMCSPTPKEIDMDDKSVVVSRELLIVLYSLGLIGMEGLLEVCIGLLDM